MRSEQEAFEKIMEYLKDDLSQAQITHDEAEAHEQEAIADCQHALKVFKFQKDKEGYEDGKCGAPPRYSLDIGSSLEGEVRLLLGTELPTLPSWRPHKILPLGMQRP